MTQTRLNRCCALLRFSSMALLMLMTTRTVAQEIGVMTFNIRYDNPGDGEDAWSKRRQELGSFIVQSKSDIIGLQEVMHHQLKWLDSLMTDHAFVGVGRGDGDTSGEYSPIFYNEKKFELISSSTFWLSETPDKVSIGWDASLPRICTWAIFRDYYSNREFLVMNAHFDHIGVIAREKSAELMIEKMKEISAGRAYPVIVTGDMNAVNTEETINTFSGQLIDVLQATYGVKEVDGTFNGFDLTKAADKRIDYIFTKGMMLVEANVATERRSNGRYLSDHFAVISKLKIPTRKH